MDSSFAQANWKIQCFKYENPIYCGCAFPSTSYFKVCSSEVNWIFFYFLGYLNQQLIYLIVSWLMSCNYGSDVGSVLQTKLYCWIWEVFKRCWNVVRSPNRIPEFHPYIYCLILWFNKIVSEIIYRPCHLWNNIDREIIYRRFGFKLDRVLANRQFEI